MSYEILISDQVNDGRLVVVSISNKSLWNLVLIASLGWIVFKSSVSGLYLILGLLILSGLFSVSKIQIQPKFFNIMLIGLLSMGIVVLYAFTAFESVGVWEICSIILFYASSVYLAKTHAILQSISKTKKETWFRYFQSRNRLFVQSRSKNLFESQCKRKQIV